MKLYSFTEKFSEGFFCEEATADKLSKLKFSCDFDYYFRVDH